MAKGKKKKDKGLKYEDTARSIKLKIDKYGDKLANGLYLYRVLVKKDGEKIDHFETDADAMFSHDIGKLYIIR